MSFSISNNSLGNIMRQVCQIISDREQASIMGHVLLEGKKGNIRFTTVNEDTQITSRIPCTTTEEFTRTLPARRLASICQNLPQEADIQISFQKDSADLSSSVGSSKYTLHCLPSDDFYQINLDGDDEDLSESTPLKLPRADFLYLISKTQSCMGVADVRQYLNGILLDIQPDKIRMVATDGNRMAVCDKPLAGKDKHQAILSRRVIERLPRILHGKGDDVEDDDVSVFIGSNFMRLKWGDISISTRLVKGQYPDYQVAMPKVAAENQILVPHADFRSALSRVASIMNIQSRGIRLSLSGETVKLSSANALGEKAEAAFSLADKYDGPGMNMAFNVDFMLKALEGLSEEESIRLFIRDSVSSFLVLPKESEDIQYVIMPMRL